MKVSVLKKDQGLNLFLRKNSKVTDKQGEQLLNPCLKQNKDNIPETGPRILQTGAETGPQTVFEIDSPRNQDGNDCVAEDIFSTTMEAPKFTPP